MPVSDTITDLAGARTALEQAQSIFDGAMTRMQAIVTNVAVLEGMRRKGYQPTAIRMLESEMFQNLRRELRELELAFRPFAAQGEAVTVLVDVGTAVPKKH